ncbi:CHAT domain-containing tetratricopeptide repeat protein [Nonomuraea jabiensis]|uniref:CHAT domain-containing tetratricopeptide repeat protein n=1 Tax=Nonomuraea jabiensis TaxID=882448 RepID=UPI003D74FF3B
MRAGEDAYFKGELETAARALGRALELWIALAPVSDRVASCLNFLGRVHQDQGELKKAGELFEEALRVEIRRTGEPAATPEAGNALNNLGRLAFARGDLDEAAALYQRAITIFETGGRPTAESAVIVGNLGTVHDTRGEYDDAMSCYQQALNLTRQLSRDGNPAAAATCLNNIGGIHHVRGELSQALAAYREALRLFEAARQPAGGAAVLANLGHVTLDQGDHATARQCYEAALATSRAIDAGSPQTADACLALSRLLLADGDLDEGMRVIRQAMDIAAAVAPGSATHASALASLAHARQLAGDLGPALEAHRQVLKMRRGLAARSAGTATALNNLGAVYQDMGDLQRALHYYEQARDLQLTLAPAAVATASMHSNVGTVLRAMGQTEAALAQYETALEIDRRAAPGSVAYATDLSNIGGVRAAQGDLDGALDHLTRAYEADQARSPDSPAVAASLANLAWVRLRRGEDGEALRLARKALEIDRRHVPRSDREAADLMLLGEIARVRDDVDGAVALLRQAVDLSEMLRNRSGTTPNVRESALAERHIAYHKLVAALHAKGDHADAFHQAERVRARAMSDLLAERGINLTPTTEEQRVLVADDRRLRHRLSALHRRPDRMIAEHDRAEVQQVEEELETVLTRLRTVFPGYADLRAPTSLTLGQAQEVLHDDEVMLAYTVTGDAVFGWSVTRSTARMAELPLTPDHLRDLVEAATEAYRQGDQGGDAERHAQEELARLALHPLLSEGTDRKPRMIIVPEGRLAYLPFELLPHPQGGLLSERHVLSYTPSATVLSQLRGSAAEQADGVFLGFGAPLPPAADGDTGRPLSPPAGEGLSPLPGTRRELQAISEVFGDQARVYLGPAATEAAVRREAQGYRFIHFATHGMFNDVNPLYSGLILSPPTPAELATSADLDEILQMHEIFDLRLRAQVVTCSACDSGLGRMRAAEGMVGLSRALLYAGARNVVLTLWPVHDTPTRRLMRYFYEGLARGLTPATALSAAKAEARRNRPRIYQDPGTWAPFIVIGAD